MKNTIVNGLTKTLALLMLSGLLVSCSLIQKKELRFPIVKTDNIDFKHKGGFIDETGEVVIEPEFDDNRSSFIVFSLFSNGLSLVNIGEKYGYIDITGKFVINPQFDEALPFSEGLAVVKIDDKWGFIDTTGKIVIQPQFDEVFPFSEDLAAVSIDDKLGFIDKTGKFVISPQFEQFYSPSLISFSEGLAAVEIENKWGYIDKTGTIVINPKFDKAFPFSEGLAAVYIDGKFGYIDKTGKIVIQPQFNYTDSLSVSFSEGLAVVEIDGKFGYIDKTGKIVIQPQFEPNEDGTLDIVSDVLVQKGISSFSEGLAAVRIDDKDGYSKYGYINKKGEIVIEPKFDTVSSFSDGLALVLTKKQKWGYIDKTGKYIYSWDAPAIPIAIRSESVMLLGQIMRAQQAFYIENNRFATTIDELGIGREPNTDFYDYQVIPGNLPRNVMVTATSKNKNLISYAITVFAINNRTVAIMCQTDQPSTTPPKLPIVYNGKPRCASGSSQVR
jgi:hypothetical protein